MNMNMNRSSTIIILICFISFFLTFSYARIPFQINDILDRANTNSFSVSQNDPSHPTQNPKPETTLVHPTQSSNGLPLTLFSFDTRNPRHPSPLRIRHRCHHYKPWKPTPRQIPLSNKHIRTRPPFRHVARGWTRLGHVEPILSRQRGIDIDTSQLLTRLYRPHHRHDYDSSDNIKDTAFVKRIRKFLNHF